jgi:hypothetical protein
MLTETKTKLTDLICRQISQPASPAIHALADTLLGTYGKTVLAVLFYGSCLRTGTDRDGMVDLYVIVDSYSAAFPKSILSALNKLLPPNVFYLEVPFEGRKVRAKYAVVSMEDFNCGTSKCWFHSYLWGRFAQPVGLLYGRNDRVAEQIQSALAQAVLTFIARVLPLVPSPFTPRELWRKGLELSYRTELRAERPHKLVRLFEAAPDYYERITRAALVALPFPIEIQESDAGCRYTVHISKWTRRVGRLDWMVRSWQGKILSVLRLIKGTLTFHGGVDYILWKIERHSGVRVEAPPRLKRYTFLATCFILWRLFRQGAYR